MAAFLEAPIFSDASKLRLDHITTLLALLLEDPFRSTTISLICKSYSKEDAVYIWSQWESRIQVPQSYPLAGNIIAKDRILAMLLIVYTVPEPAAADTRALTDFVSVAIPVETCRLFTIMTLQEE